ncbi:hypothetical protein [Acinetobacter terrestris]|uniref:hypothetical protein n=1 Tax=Acinetobacter TaxID=469 RepID=UPI00148F84E3|nr:hypothetical protein [Acinetobacter terrestris]NNH36610.1 hypothetical protein [Acinetobacter terrestris]
MVQTDLKNLIYKHFKSAIVNHSDQKQGNLVSINQLHNIAEQAQVSFIYQSITSAQVSARAVIEFSKYSNQLLKVILIICRTGTHSALLFNEAKKPGLLNE